MSNIKICLKCTKEITNKKLTVCPFCECIDLLDKDSYDSIIQNYKNASNTAKQMFYKDPTFIKLMNYHPEMFKREMPNPVIYTKPQSQQNTNKPKCPTCGSTNVKHISTLNRAVSIGVFGLFSSKIGKNYECLNCKSKW